MVTPKEGAGGPPARGGDAGAGRRRRSWCAASIYGLVAEPGRRDDQQRLASPPFHVSVLMTGCWPALAETARAQGPESAEPAGVDGLTPLRESSMLALVARARRGRAVPASAAAARRSDAAPSRRRRRPPAPARPPTPGRQALPRPLRAGRRPRLADRPGRRHRRRGAGLRDADRGRHRRRGALRPDLGLDEGEPAPRRRADLLPVARRRDRGPRGRPPTPTWTPRARCSWRRAASTAPTCATRRSSWARRSCAKETAEVDGRAGAGRRPVGQRTPQSPSTPATSRPPRSRRSGKASGDGRWGSLSASSRTITGL